MDTFFTTVMFVAILTSIGANVWFVGLCNSRAEAAHGSALRAEQSEVRLKAARGDVIALRTHVGALEAQLNRLQGRVYAQGRHAPNDLAGALKGSDDARARAAGAAYEAMGVGIAAPDATQKVCQCGYCDVCLNGPTAPVQAH